MKRTLPYAFAISVLFGLAACTDPGDINGTVDNPGLEDPSTDPGNTDDPTDDPADAPVSFDLDSGVFAVLDLTNYHAVVDADGNTEVDLGNEMVGLPYTFAISPVAIVGIYNDWISDGEAVNGEFVRFDSNGVTMGEYGGLAKALAGFGLDSSGNVFGLDILGTLYRLDGSTMVPVLDLPEVESTYRSVIGSANGRVLIIGNDGDNRVVIEMDLDDPDGYSEMVCADDANLLAVMPVGDAYHGITMEYNTDTGSMDQVIMDCESGEVIHDLTGLVETPMSGDPAYALDGTLVWQPEGSLGYMVRDGEVTSFGSEEGVPAGVYVAE